MPEIDFKPGDDFVDPEKAPPMVRPRKMSPEAAKLFEEIGSVFTIAEVAHYLKTDQATVRRWVREGRWPRRADGSPGFFTLPTGRIRLYGDAVYQAMFTPGR